MRILIVEDDEYITTSLANILANEHYVVDVAADGQTGWELVEAFTYDLILLDVLIPKLGGIEFCQQLRSRGDQTPVLLLTAQNASTDKVKGLDAGADDYVVKPFEVSELLARIRVLLRRKDSLIPSVLKWENLRLDPSTRKVTYGYHLLSLTPTEYRLLELFLRSHHHVFSRSAILERLWPSEEAPSEDTITAHIKGLRHKLKQAGAPTDFIETVYGLGYRLKLPASPMLGTSTLSQAEENSIRQQTRTALAIAWEKLKGLSSDRIAILEQATRALRENTLESELRQEAQQAAHKLAGALGVFGFTEGSHLAQEIEQGFRTQATENQNEARHLFRLVVALRRLLTKPTSSQLTEPVVNHGYPLILVVDDDAELAEQIFKEALASGLCVELAASIAAARDALTQLQLDVVLLNLKIASAPEDQLTLLTDLTNQTPPIPVLLLAADENLLDKVKVARAVAAHIALKKPEFPDRVLEVVTKVLKQNRGTEAKVMVVDDDPQVLVAMRDLLEPWGLRLVTLDEPLQFWRTLEEFSPDLLVLDVEMPRISGFELCQVIRSDPRWCGLPILFYTVHTDASTVHQALTVGADDHISKSMIGRELVNRVLSRIERAQMLRSTANTDSLQLR